MKRLLPVFALLLACRLGAQTLSPFVVSSSGGFFNAGSVSLSTTVSEMTMVETFISSGPILTQGFQQPNDRTVAVEPVVSGDFSLLVYPNPASENVVVVADFGKPGKILLQIFNDLGQMVTSDEEENSTGDMFKTDVNLSTFASGIYNLRILYSSNENNHRVAEQKISVIK